MNKICVVAKNFNTYFLKRLTEEVGMEDLIFFNPWSDQDLPSADIYLVRSTGVYGSDRDLDSLAKADGVVLNPMKSLRLFRDKNLQYQFFRQHQIPHLPWMDLKNVSLQEAQEFLKKHSVGLVKPHRGQGGWGIGTFDSVGFEQWWKDKEEKDDFDYLLQPYLDEAKELRLFFVEDEVICLGRKAQQGVAANFQQEGEAWVENFPVEFDELIKRVIQLSGAQYGAIDLMIKGSDIYFLELNTVPGIEQLEKVTGKNIISELLCPLISKCHV